MKLSIVDSCILSIDGIEIVCKVEDFEELLEPDLRFMSRQQTGSLIQIQWHSNTDKSAKNWRKKNK